MNLWRTKLTPEQKEGLELARNHGRHARQAWDHYMKALIEDRRAEIFDTFRKVRPNDVDQIVILRHLLAAVDDIEKAVLIDIDRGEYAAKQLNEDIHD